MNGRSSDKRDAYEVLGVERSASAAQIKTAYRKAALKSHPDKAPPAEREQWQARFTELSESHEVLSDDDKRARYDQMGWAGLEGAGGGGGGMDPNDLLSQMFGGGGLGSMFGGGGMRQQGPRKARTIHHVHMVSLEDIYRGKTSKLALQKSVICSKCDGRGGKEGAVKTCSTCGGQGRRTMLRQMGPMIQRFEAACDDCDGLGETIRDKDRCKQCHGKKTVVERKVLHVHVDKGVAPGKKIDFKGEGDQQPGVEAGDVQFEIQQKPHPRFERNGDNLAYEAEIDLLTALAGGAIYIEHLDERWLTVEIIPGEVIAPDSIKVIRGQGMPSYRHHENGDLFIKFKVNFPEKLTSTDGGSMTDEQRAALESVLPPRMPQSVPPADAMTEDFQLEAMDMRRDGPRAGGATAMDEDDDDVPHGAQNVQCQSQ